MRAQGKYHVLVVDAFIVRKLGDGLFLKTFQETAAKYQSYGIETKNLIIDNTAMQLVSRPSQFDVIVTPNLYGNIVTNIGAGLVGGPGFISGYSIGENYAIYEPAGRFVAKKLEGKDLANPTTLLLSACYMLSHLGLSDYAAVIERCIYDIFANNPKFQQSPFRSSEFLEALLQNLRKN